MGSREGVSGPNSGEIPGISDVITKALDIKVMARTLLLIIRSDLSNFDKSDEANAIRSLTFKIEDHIEDIGAFLDSIEFGCDKCTNKPSASKTTRRERDYRV